MPDLSGIPDPSQIFYGLMALWIALSVAIFGVSLRKKGQAPTLDKPEATTPASVGVMASPGEAPVYRIGDQRNPLIEIMVFEPGESTTSGYPIEVPEAAKEIIGSLLDKADSVLRTDPAQAPAAYRLRLGSDNNSNVHDSANLQMWQIALFITYSDLFTTIAESMSYISANIEQVDSSLSGGAMGKQMQQAYSKLASIGPVITDQRYSIDEIDAHLSTLRERAAELEPLRNELAQMLKGPEEYIRNLNFGRASHKSRITLLLSQIAAFGAAAYCYAILLRIEAAILSLKLLLPIAPDTPDYELRQLNDSVKFFRQRVNDLNASIERRLPELSSFFGKLLEKQHEQHRSDVRTAVEDAIGPVQRLLEATDKLIASSLHRAPKATGERIEIVAQMDSGKVKQVRRVFSREND